MWECTMSIEQYFGGRIRYIQVGDNGNDRPGVGCYAKSPEISGEDVVEIQRRYKQYLNTEQNKKGVKPTIYKRMLLPTGTVLMTACSYIPSPKGKNGVIDRPDWIDHSYLIQGSDPAVLDPEQWLGLPYRKDDPNPTWEVMPPEIAEEIKRGKVYKSEKWITAESLSRLPKSDFRLLPLADVLQMWELDDLEMVDLAEAAMDCVAAPDMGGRKLFIKYNIDAEDCSDNRYWDHNTMDAEQFNLFRMEHLLSWIYHLIPFSFRRRLGYDTTLDAIAGYHQIIFVPENRIRVTADRQYGYLFPTYDGTNLTENKNIMMTGGGYYYDPDRGIWHNTEGGHQDYKELYQTDGIIQKLIGEEVSRYMKAGSMEEIRRIIKEYYDLFTKIEKHIPIFSDSIAELESEIPRWRAELVADPEELKGMALTLMAREGSEDIAVNEGNYDYFLSVMAALERRITDENREILWTPVLEHAVMRPAFTDQMNFVQELTGTILRDPDPLNRFYQYTGREDFNNASVNGNNLLNWIFAGLCENKEFRSRWLFEQYGDATEYTSRLASYDAVRKVINSLASVMETSNFHAANKAYYESLPLLTDTANVTSLLTIDRGQLSNEAFELARSTAKELPAQYRLLEIYGQVAEAGPEAYRAFRNRISRPAFDSADVLLDLLLETVLGEWLGRFRSERISPEELSSVIDLINENRNDKRFNKWSMALIDVTGVSDPANTNSLFDSFTTSEFGRYLNRITGTDETMLKNQCRYQLFNSAANAIMRGAVKWDREDIKFLSEFMTSQSKDEGVRRNEQIAEWNKKRVDSGTNCLINIVTDRIRAERSLAFAAGLFGILNDGNVLNCGQMLSELLPEARKIVDTLSSSGRAGEKDIREFEQVFRWWSTEPEVRAERRKIVRAANYTPSFSEISDTIEAGTRADFERLSDNGFIYDSDRYRVNDAGSLLRTMLRKPEELSKAEWISYYCDWVGEAFRKPDLGRTLADYHLLDVMSEVILTEGVKDVSPGARVNQDWLKSLDTNGLKTDKLEKKGIRAESLFTLIGVKDACEQLTAVKPKKVNVNDSSVNSVVENMIGNGKVNVRFSDRTLDAVCAYVREQPNFFSQILLIWRADRIVKLIEALRGNGKQDEQEMGLYQGLFDRKRIVLNRIYTETEMRAFRKALGMSDRQPRRPGNGGPEGSRLVDRSRMSDRSRSSDAGRSSERTHSADISRSAARNQSAGTNSNAGRGRVQGDGRTAGNGKRLKKGRNGN